LRLLLKLGRDSLGGLDVPVLSPLVAAAEKDDGLRAAPNEIDPISRAVVDPQFAHSFAERLRVAKQTKLMTPDSSGNSNPRMPVFEGPASPVLPPVATKHRRRAKENARDPGCQP
jgi:hypothetical protein